MRQFLGSVASPTVPGSPSSAVFQQCHTSQSTGDTLLRSIAYVSPEYKTTESTLSWHRVRSPRKSEHPFPPSPPPSPPHAHTKVSYMPAPFSRLCRVSKAVLIGKGIGGGGGGGQKKLKSFIEKKQKTKKNRGKKKKK